MFVSVLVEGNTPSVAASKSNLHTWIADLKIPFSTGVDLPQSPFGLKTALGPRETVYVLERTTHKILARTVGIADAFKKLDELP